MDYMATHNLPAWVITLPIGLQLKEHGACPLATVYAWKHLLPLLVRAQKLQALCIFPVSLAQLKQIWFSNLVLFTDPCPLCFQAMRFPPKSYNKDLESAEVRAHWVSWLLALSSAGPTSLWMLKAPLLATLPGSAT